MVMLQSNIHNEHTQKGWGCFYRSRGIIRKILYQSDCLIPFKINKIIRLF